MAILRLLCYGILSHMYRERVVMQEGVMEVAFLSPDDFLLAVTSGSQTLVEYRPGRRIVRGRAMPYEFKSVEKLRYDFEQDAKDA